MKAAIMYLALFVGMYVITGLIVRKNCIIELPFSKDFTTVIKGFAIAVVIYGHLGNLFHIRYLTPLGGIGVALFLIASGYGINESWKKNGPEHFWKKRMISVYIPYLIIELAATPIRGGISEHRRISDGYYEHSFLLLFRLVYSFHIGMLCVILFHNKIYEKIPFCYMGSNRSSARILCTATSGKTGFFIPYWRYIE